MEIRTEPVYYQDPYQTKLTTIVRDLTEDAEGIWICTDQTLFYPGGGGQLADQGTIDSKPLKNIRKEDKKIWHNVPDFDGNIEDTVSLELDWPRRFYMMQQHSGQHLLSHVLNKHGFKTVSVHLGETHTLIETEGDIPSTETLAQIEQQANTLIQNHLALHIHWVKRNELSKFPLRRPAGDWKKLRIVEIDQIEFAACGGTHVRNTAEIGLIKFAHMQRIRRHTRLQFYIGKAAYDYLDVLHIHAQGLKQILQSEIHQLNERAAAIYADLEQQRKQAEFFRRAYLNQICETLNSDNEGFIFQRNDQLQAEDVSYLARALANNFSRTAFLISGSRFYFIRPRDKTIDLRDFMRRHAQALDARGGGPQDFIQGIMNFSDDTALKQLILDFLNEHDGGNI